MGVIPCNQLGFIPRRMADGPAHPGGRRRPMVRALIARALSDEGYEVVAVASGRAALDAARGAEVGFDLIVTNNYMPDLNGAELIAQVRQDFPGLPILHIDDISRRKSVQNLPDDVPTVYKPFSVTSLREAVRKLLAG